MFLKYLLNYLKDIKPVFMKSQEIEQVPYKNWIKNGTDIAYIGYKWN